MLRYTTRRFLQTAVPMAAVAACALFLISEKANAQALPPAEKAVASENVLALKAQLKALKAENKEKLVRLCNTTPSHEECVKRDQKAVARLEKAIAKEKAKMN